MEVMCKVIDQEANHLLRALRNTMQTQSVECITVCKPLKMIIC